MKQHIWRYLVIGICLVSGTSCTYLRRTPDHSDQRQSLTLVDAGSSALRRGNLLEAQAAFEVARDLTHAPAAYDGLGCVAFLRGDINTAQRYFTHAFERNRNYTTALANLALVHEYRGQYEEARALYDYAVALDPGNFRARNNAALLLLRYAGDSSGKADSADRKKKNLAVLAELRRSQALMHHPLVAYNVARVQQESYE